MRENEFHLLKRTAWFSCPFVVLTANAPATQAPSTTATRPAVPTVTRRRVAMGAKHTAAPAPSSAEVTIAPGAPSTFRAGISSRHPAPAPSRSTAYTALTLAVRREIAIEIAAPPVKNGSAESTYIS